MLISRFHKVKCNEALPHLLSLYLIFYFFFPLQPLLQNFHRSSRTEIRSVWSNHRTTEELADSICSIVFLGDSLSFMRTSLLLQQPHFHSCWGKNNRHSRCNGMAISHTSFLASLSENFAILLAGSQYHRCWHHDMGFLVLDLFYKRLSRIRSCPVFYYKQNQIYAYNILYYTTYVEPPIESLLNLIFFLFLNIKKPPFCWHYCLNHTFMSQ